ncbi:nitrous oxide reductase family maturation protein NosD [bacterium]|nr:nitrous oxide reductase family maturation protein NosD [bacterium]
MTTLGRATTRAGWSGLLAGAILLVAASAPAATDEHEVLYEPVHIGAAPAAAATRWTRVAPPRPADCLTAAADRDLQTALDAAPDGATICLEPGRHAGPITVARALTLWGPAEAVIASKGVGTTVRVTGAGARLLGFTVDGSGGRFDTVDAAVKVGASDVAVEGLTVVHAAFGILVERAQRVTVRGNDIVGDPALPFGLRGDGIRLWEVDGATIAHNRLTDSRDMVVWYSRDNQVIDNVVVRGRYGTHFMYSHRNQVRRNRYVDNVVGVFVMYSRDVTLADNLMAGSGGAAGMGIGLKESGNVTATQNVLVRDTIGVYIDTSPLANDDANRFARNAIRLSGTAVVFHGRATRNHFLDNSFRDNLAQVESRGGTTALDAEWRGNDFDDYAGYDFDGDGFGDVPYELHSLTTTLIGRYPSLAYFRGGLALFAVDTVNHIAPLFRPTTLLVDSRPRMQPLVDEGALRDAIDAH